ncbi:MAG: hypothetical protein QW272_08840 [Candidatus Methanomethylicaceae archaeon]
MFHKIRKRSKKMGWLKKKKERYEKYLEKLLIKNELKNIPKIFDHKEREVISLEKGIYIEEGEVLYSPKYISPIIKKILF